MHRKRLTMHKLDGATVTVTMGGSDVTSSVYADGVINISRRKLSKMKKEKLCSIDIGLSMKVNKMSIL